MLDLRLTSQLRTEDILALPVVPGQDNSPGSAIDEGPHLLSEGGLSDDDLREIVAFLVDVEHSGAGGTVHVLPRPTRTPRRLLLFGVGGGDEAAWRSAGAALVSAARRDEALTVSMPADAAPAAIRGICEGMWLAAYRYRLGADDPDRVPRLQTVTIGCHGSAEHIAALAAARAVAEATCFARDVTNTPSSTKTPEWFAGRVVEAVDAIQHLSVDVFDQEWLAEQGFGGVLAVGRASASEPKLVVLAWDPPGASHHVVLVGKGITFDTGGIVLKPRESMKLMRKDMGGAAAVIAAVLGAANLGLPVRVTALTPLAENAVGADAYRPGDVVRHVDGTTSEIIDTDAEGRLVLADTLAYAASRLQPDTLIDLGTLTGAQNVALGKRTAALFTESDPLAEDLAHAAAQAGESVWRMPLVDDYADALKSDIADVANAAVGFGGGAITAALYLREFTGSAREHWAHLDMSAPAWSDAATGELAKGATGWGVRTLLRWLGDLAAR